jgi:ABC-type branched-subunit amino acid transport system substrate-binding protein
VRAALAVAVALAVAGCSAQGTSSSAVTVSGRQLDIYISDPQDVQSDSSLQDVVYAAQLAFAKNHGTVTRYRVQLATLKSKLPSENAREAIHDKSAIAYIGEIKPGDSVQTAGITEALDLLQLSPTETAGIPNGDYEQLSTYGRTFAHLPASGVTAPGFASSFRKLYGHAPSAQAVRGYVAMNWVLQSLQQLGTKANNRGSVAGAVRKLANG